MVDLELEKLKVLERIALALEQIKYEIRRANP